VLVVTHDPRLEGYADKVFHMADGLLRAEGADETAVGLTFVDDDTREHAPLPTDAPRLRLADPPAVAG
jgi:hypothetical protein